MAAHEKQWYRDQAKKELQKLGLNPRGDDLTKLAADVKDDTDVSRGTNPGGWVQVWLWVPDTPKAEDTTDVGQRPQDAQ